MGADIKAYLDLLPWSCHAHLRFEEVFRHSTFPCTRVVCPVCLNPSTSFVRVALSCSKLTEQVLHKRHAPCCSNASGHHRSSYHVSCQNSRQSTSKTTSQGQGRVAFVRESWLGTQWITSSPGGDFQGRRQRCQPFSLTSPTKSKRVGPRVVIRSATECADEPATRSSMLEMETGFARVRSLALIDSLMLSQTRTKAL